MWRGTILLLITHCIDELRKLTTAFALCGRICISGIWSVIMIYTSELYPTAIRWCLMTWSKIHKAWWFIIETDHSYNPPIILCRNVGLGAGIFWARIGGIVAPQLSLLVRVFLHTVPLCCTVLGTLRSTTRPTRRRGLNFGLKMSADLFML